MEADTNLVFISKFKKASAKIFFCVHRVTPLISFLKREYFDPHNLSIQDIKAPRIFQRGTLQVFLLWIESRLNTDDYCCIGFSINTVGNLLEMGHIAVGSQFERHHLFCPRLFYEP